MKNLINLLIYSVCSPWPLSTILTEILLKEKKVNILIGGGILSKIYPIYRFIQINTENSNYIFNSKPNKKTGDIIAHNQLSISTMEVDHNQNSYALNYELQEDGKILFSENTEIKENIDKIIINKSESILNTLLKKNLMSQKEINNVEKGLDKFKTINEKIIYQKKAIGYITNNLTTSSNNDSILFHKISSTKSLYLYTKTGIITVNRNDKDYIRSIVYLTEELKNNKGLQKYNINEEKQQIMAEEIMKGIGGYENIKWVNHIWTKEQMLKIIVCSWIYLQNQKK